MAARLEYAGQWIDLDEAVNVTTLQAGIVAAVRRGGDFVLVPAAGGDDFLLLFTSGVPVRLYVGSEPAVS